MDAHIINMILTQYSLKARLRKFKGKVKKAVTKELQQLHDMETFYPVDAKKTNQRTALGGAGIANVSEGEERRNHEGTGMR